MAAELAIYGEEQEQLLELYQFAKDNFFLYYIIKHYHCHHYYADIDDRQILSMDIIIIRIENDKERKECIEIMFIQTINQVGFCIYIQS